MITGNILMSVSPGVSAYSASGSSSTSLQAQIDVDEDFVADADLIAASVMGEAMPSTLAHDSTLAHVHNSDTKTDIAEEQQVSTPIELVSISKLENITGTSDGGDNDDEQVTHDQVLHILEWEQVQDSTLARVHNSDTKTDIAKEQQVSAPMELVSISELENATGTSDGGDNDDEQVTHDQVLGILEWEPVQEQQISINAEGAISVVNDDMQHANVDEEINVSYGWNKETCRRKANVGKVRRKIFDS